MPNGGDPGLLFDLTISGVVQHVWGNKGVSEKEISQNYRFGRIRDTRITSLNGASDLYSTQFAAADEGRLWLPGGSDRKQEEARNADVWQTLSDLPKLTVSELYVSLDREYGQRELDKKFLGLRVAPRWFAARSGQEWAGMGTYTVMDAQGNVKPAQPEDYLNLYVQNPVGARGGMGDNYIPVRNETNREYLKHGALSWKSGLVEALKRIAQSPEVAASVSPIDFASAAAEVEANGSKVYGVVVTGRSEELAKLQSEPWMKGAIVRMGDSALDTIQLDPYVSYR
nr:anti sigma factor C-terminal domain-containing protein [Saccharibacillus deserti]